MYAPANGDEPRRLKVRNGCISSMSTTPWWRAGNRRCAQPSTRGRRRQGIGPKRSARVRDASAQCRSRCGDTRAAALGHLCLDQSVIAQDTMWGGRERRRMFHSARPRRCLRLLLGLPRSRAGLVMLRLPARRAHKRPCLAYVGRPLGTRAARRGIPGGPRARWGRSRLTPVWCPHLIPQPVASRAPERTTAIREAVWLFGGVR